MVDSIRLGQSGGGGGGSQRGVLQKLGQRLLCAAEFADSRSWAAITGTQNSFLGKALLGNTFSGLTQLGLLAAGVPNNATASDVAIGMLSGTHQGLPGGGNIGKGPLGVAQEALVGGAAAGAYNGIVGAGTQTLELGVSASSVAGSVAGVSAKVAGGAVAALKTVDDATVFLIGIVKCKP